MRETNYQFRQHLNQVHQPNRCDPQARPTGREFRIGASDCRLGFYHANVVKIPGDGT